MYDSFIEHNFKFCIPQKKKKEKHHKIAENAEQLAKLINIFCPDGREKSLAITKIEEAVMWANASIAREV